jgi:hypothetical protein
MAWPLSDQSGTDVRLRRKGHAGLSVVLVFDSVLGNARNMAGDELLDGLCPGTDRNRATCGQTLPVKQLSDNSDLDPT